MTHYSDNLPYAYCEQIGKEIRDVSDEIPFDIPDSWEWARCSTIGAIIRGSGIKRTETVESGMPCVRYGELYTTYNTSFTKTVSFVPQELFEQCKQIKYGDVLFTLTGENKPDIAKTVVYMGDETVAVGGDLAFWTHHGMNPLYLVYFMASPYTIGRKVNLATGDIIVHISGEKIGSIPIPIPPLAEQDRIVAKIHELEPFINEYNYKNEAVSSLNTTFPEALKKSILQEAVQGKLVPQTPDDEPASVLLERIRAEKQALIKAGKIKKDKHESVIVTRDKIPYEIIDGKERCIADEVPFELPDSWCWCRLGDILLKLSDGTHSTPKYTEIGVPFISVKDVSAGKLDFSNCKHISEKEHTELYERCNPEFGDILLTKVGTTGIPVIVDTDKQFSLFVSVALLKFNQELLYNKYLLYMINSPLVQKQATENTKGVGNKNWVMRDIANTLIAIPPIEEQHRIVSKIEEIMPFINTISK